LGQVRFLQRHARHKRTGEQMNDEVMWLDGINTLYVDNDLNYFLLENSFDTDSTLTTQTFVEFWELVLEWQKEVQK
jgi:hypothetical protein